ncbi:MAG: NAD(P)H-hydrate dehydratase [Eubacterium sp.]|nr:NAD(P)H-hydrate dehydratase [Eubacterium sp.]
MRVLTANEIRKVEELCFRDYSSEAELMLKAGTACFKAMTEKYDMKNKSVLVFCGNGKNAGDGFVIARLLYCYGANAEIVLCDKEPAIAEPLKYYKEAVSSGVKVNSLTSKLAAPDYIVDTIFGIGFHGEARAPFDKAFEWVNASGATVICVDTPSGTNATTGEVCKDCVKADYTIAISTLKYCHILPPANEYCGENTVVNIGIPEDCYTGEYADTIEAEEVKSLFRARRLNSNKGDFGHQLNICGSYKMFGASVIATEAALRSGAGLVKLTTPKSAYPLSAAHLTQPIFNPVWDTEEGTFSKYAIPEILNDLKWADSIVLGCGIGVNDDTKELCENVLLNAECPVILDADGINCIKERISIFEEIKVPIVLTPHPGEMARLISKQVAEIQENRIEYAKAFATESKVILVLKGANTVVTDGKRVFVNTSGNSGMAMGGSGDMLSGIIGAFIAQGLAPFDAARAAVYIHGLCGDISREKLSQRGMLVSDMTEQLGVLMSEFE